MVTSRPKPVRTSLRPFGLDLVATGVTLDSRAVCPGDIFVALPGTNRHGIDFAAQAREAGAVAVLTDPVGADLNDSGLPTLAVADPRTILGELAAAVYGQPSESVPTFGITGTNGKTSTVFLVAAALRSVGLSVGTIGTLGFRLDDAELVVPRTTITTPEAPDLQALLGVLVEHGAQALALEVSSHSLASGRVLGTRFAAVGFTMFGHDHLDYHGTVDDYFTAKARLFSPEFSERAVVTIDDDGGRRIARLAAERGLRVETVSGTGLVADYFVKNVQERADGTSEVVFATPEGEVAAEIGLMGGFNVANALLALALTAPCGDIAKLAAGFASAQVPGRMQRVPLSGLAPFVVVDFAHTPQAVAAAISALPKGRKIVVLGCGGDRDPAKRRPIGRAAGQAADVVIVTDDNPRSEDPAQIRAEVLAGARSAGLAQVIDGGDRRSAIEMALAQARAGDWVAILGKGHERGQEIEGKIIPFDDVAVVHELWKGRQCDC